MNHPDITVPNFMEIPMFRKRVKQRRKVPLADDNTHTCISMPQLCYPREFNPIISWQHSCMYFSATDVLPANQDSREFNPIISWQHSCMYFSATDVLLANQDYHEFNPIIS